MTEIASGGVTLVGIPQQDFRFTFRLTAGMVAADIGKPVALSTAANNTAKLAGDGAVVIGRLLTYRNVVTEGILIGTVEMKGGFRSFCLFQTGSYVNLYTSDVTFVHYEH